MTTTRIISGALVAVLVSGALAPAFAGDWRYRSRGPYYAPRSGISPGGAAALGVLGGLAVGGAIAAASRPVYAAPVYVAPAPRVVEEECYVERAREWVPGWGWQVRKRTVCE